MTTAGPGKLAGMLSDDTAEAAWRRFERSMFVSGFLLAFVFLAVGLVVGFAIGLIVAA